MRPITIDGSRYEVTENLGRQGGHQTKVVATPDGDRKLRVAVKRGGCWTFWTNNIKGETCT